MLLFNNSILYILESFIKFASDEYIDFNGIKQKGNNELNKLLDSKLQIENFSLGYIKSMPKSFLWVTISEGESFTENSYIGDSASFTDSISIKAHIYKELKSGESFLAYTMIPLALNQIARFWISKINDDGESIAISPTIKWESPKFDSTNNNRQFNDFSSIRGINFSLYINLKIKTGSYLK